jgi:hypothetical protein
VSSPRNILFLMTDQHRVDTLGAYGNPLARTPVLDELARTGTRFDRWYTPTAICTPARASLLTGQAPFRHKLLANQERNVGYSEDLPDGTWTFPRALRTRGYNCGLVGKWHAGTVKTPADYGLDGVHLPGWHNPVDHPDYLDYLAERGLPPYRISDRIRGTLPNGGPGNLLAARLHQPVEATFEYYLATRTIEMLHRSNGRSTMPRSSWPCTSSARTCPTSCRRSTSTWSTSPPWRCPARSPRRSRASRRCSATTAPTGRSTPCRSR